MASIFELTKLSLRVSSNAYDDEITNLILSAFEDMARVGIKKSYLGDADIERENVPSAAANAIVCYVKSHFGYDNKEAERFNRSYRQIVCDLMNSPAGLPDE